VGTFTKEEQLKIQKLSGVQKQKLIDQLQDNFQEIKEKNQMKSQYKYYIKKINSQMSLGNLKELCQWVQEAQQQDLKVPTLKRGSSSTTACTSS